MGPQERAAFFAAKLACETDVSDVHAAMDGHAPGFVLIDTRSRESWAQGHVRGAIHMPRAEMAARIPVEYSPDTSFVVYCWGPGCNGATNSALLLSQLGHEVREMIGGFEYWAREGLPVDAASGDVTRPPDPLTAPVIPGMGIISCDC